MRAVVQHLLVAFAIGCSPAPSPSNDAGPDLAPDASADAQRDSGARGPIIDHNAWVAATAAEDPFPERVDEVDCERGFGWEVELLDTTVTVGVETAACNYLSLVQPTLRQIEAGEPLLVQLFHFQLEGDGPAHVAVALDGEVLWEETIAIPATSRLISETVLAPRAFPTGTPVVLHLHNHGLNSWNFITLAGSE